MVTKINDYSSAEISRITGATQRTIRRWQDGSTAVPDMALRLLTLLIDGELMSSQGKDWQDFRFRDGLLYIPGWTRGFAPGELRAMFFRLQALTSLEAENARLKTSIDKHEKVLIELKKQRDFYRKQVLLESRFGLIFTA